MRDDLRPFKRSVVHSVRAVLGYWRVSATGSIRATVTRDWLTRRCCRRTRISVALAGRARFI